MNSKAIILFCIGLLPIDSYAQHSSGGGTFEIYENFGIQRVEEYHYNYSGLIPCDSTPFRVKFFNEKGQMTKEVIGGYYNPYYTYDYNDEGFLINIDTNGLFGFGVAIPAPLEDTLIEEFVIYETWFSIDTIKRLKQSLKHYPKDSLRVKTCFKYDSLGRTLAEDISYQENNGTYVNSLMIKYEYNEMGLLHKIVRKEEDQVIDIKEFKYYKTN